jgi:hypothetical protein
MREISQREKNSKKLHFHFFYFRVKKKKKKALAFEIRMCVTRRGVRMNELPHRDMRSRIRTEHAAPV